MDNISETKKLILQDSLADLQKIVENADMSRIELVDVAQLEKTVRNIGRAYYNSMIVKRIESKQSYQSIYPGEIYVKSGNVPALDSIPDGIINFGAAME